MKFYSSPSFNNLPLREVQTYSEDEINALFDLSEEEAVELTKVISNQVAINKVYSSQKTEERLAEILIEANEFVTEQLGKSNFLSIDLATSIDEVVDEHILYLIADENANTNTYNQYVLIGGNVTPLGSTQCDLTNYVTNEKLEEKLEDYAKKDEVINASDIVTTIDENSTDTTVPSSATVKTFVEDSLPEIVTTLDNTATDEQVLSALATLNNYISGKTVLPIHQLDNQYAVHEVDIKTIADNYPMSQYAGTATAEQYSCRIYQPTNAPTGVVDCYVDYRFLNSLNWITVTLYDVRTNNIWSIRKTSGTWGDWVRIDSNSVQFGNLVNTTDYPENILYFPLGKHVFNYTNLTNSFIELPEQVAGILEVSTTTTSDFETGTWSYRIYRYTTCFGTEYIRNVNTGETAGTIIGDSGWKKIITTKIKDVSRTDITFDDGVTDYTLKTTVDDSNYYYIENGRCYVSLYFTCVTKGFYTPVITGQLPKSKNRIWKCANIWNNTSEANIPYPVNITIGTSGLVSFTGGQSGAQYLCSFDYPVYEN